MDAPLLSIITVTYNVHDSILTTIESIIRYKTDKLEYIIIDGASTDGTQNIIENKYANKIDVFISEPDKGIYDAMNKAIKKAKGKYFMFINSGDILLENPLMFLSNKQLDVGYDLIAFNVKLPNNNIFKSRISFISKIANTLHHQGLLYLNKKDIEFDIKYKVYADFDLNQRILKNKIKYLHINQSICYHDTGGLSNNPGNFHENYDIISKNLGSIYVILSFIYFKWRGLKGRLAKLFNDR